MTRKILKNIINNYKNKTIIFVTHRVDNIDLFDRVVKIDNKEILEDVTRNN
jgi:ABC-type transport system involved in cytochrome bd biosynthesis fused ATPase/permease subunit